MKKRLLLFLLIMLSCACAFAAEVEIEREIRKGIPRFEKADEEKVSLSSEYEYSWVKQGARKGNWRILTNRIAYLNNNLQAFYIEPTVYERLGVRDTGIDFGSYFKLKDGYLHAGAGFGADHVNFIYRSKAFLELEQKLVKQVYLNLDSKFLNYAAGDVYLFSPGLVYYFGDNYLLAGYGISFTEGRGSAQFGKLKGNFALNSKIHLWSGVALGQRLFDIETIKADEQYGYILFAGLDFIITKNIVFRLGGSYSKERPSFIKRSIDFGLTIKI